MRLEFYSNSKDPTPHLTKVLGLTT